MKKILSSTVLVLALALTGCNNQKAYNINGTVEGSNDGETVYIITYANGKLDTLNTTVIQGGKFSASGHVDSTYFAMAVYENEEGISTADFFLENADINISMKNGETSTVSGTEINQRATTLNKRISNLMQELKGNADKDKAEAINARVDEVIKQFITENIDNVAGQFYLANFRENYNTDFVKTMLDAIPQDKVTSYVSGLREEIELRENVEEGQPFVDFEAPTPDGQTLSVSQVAQNAKVLMIDFWASWCGPCRAEMPNVKATYEKYHAQGFDIIGVSLDEDADAWKKAIADLGMAWPQISDLKGWESHPAQLYGIQAIPATVLIKDGKIVARGVRGEALAPKVEELLKD